MFQSKLFSHK